MRRTSYGGLHPVLRSILGVLGIGIALISLLFVVMAIGDLTGGNAYESEVSVVVALLLFFLGTGASGTWMAWRNLRRVRHGAPETPEELEQRILSIARALRGRVTVLEVAARCGISIEEAKEALSRMNRAGVIEPSLTEDGVMVYHFPGLLSTSGHD
jgi:hypothetical protein